jgi:oxygen-dependent protoporphyrinogen oxidase
MATPGRVFDMFTNQAHALRGGGKRRPGGSLMLFAGARGAASLLRERDDAIIERFLADLRDLYPQTRGVTPTPACIAGSSATSSRAQGDTASRPHWRARSERTPTCISQATTSQSSATSKPPP